jgi:hypothetical protein
MLVHMEVDDGAGLADVVRHLAEMPARIIAVRAEQELRPVDGREAEVGEVERVLG